MELTVPTTREEIANAVRQCVDLAFARKIHARISRSEELSGSILLSNLLIDVYTRCGSAKEAIAVFRGMRSPNLYSWNIVMKSFIRSGDLAQARDAFDQMPLRSVVSFNILIAAYTHRGHMQEATQIFNSMPEWDEVTGNTMITAYVASNNVQQARMIFHDMEARTLISYNALLAVYAQNRHLDEARSLFEKMPERSIITWTSMIHGYVSNSHVEQAQILFSLMPVRDSVCWTAMIEAYAQNDVHAARALFDRMPEQDDVIAWTAMIQAYALTGNFFPALLLYHEMVVEGLSPDQITMTGTFISCNYAGLLARSRAYFTSMQGDMSLTPIVEHYYCMIDVLGRSGMLEDAEELIHTMPFHPKAIAWTTLAGASCRFKHRSGRETREFMGLDSSIPASYVLLSTVIAGQEK